MEMPSGGSDALGAFGAALTQVDELPRFARSIKAHAAPCVRACLKEATAVGATDAEIGHVFALTMRGAAGIGYSWPYGVINDPECADVVFSRCGDRG